MGNRELPAAEVEEAVSSLTELDRQISQLEARRVRILDEIIPKLRKFNIPEQAKFAAAALLMTGIRGNFTGAETNQALRFYEKTDTRLKQCAGQVIAWLGETEETLSHRDPGPNETEVVESFYIGVLPQDASLKFDKRGMGSIGVGQIEIEKNVELDLRFFGGRSKLREQLSPIQFIEHLSMDSLPVYWVGGKPPVVAIGNTEVLRLIGSIGSESDQQQLRELWTSLENPGKK